MASTNERAKKRVRFKAAAVVLNLSVVGEEEARDLQPVQVHVKFGDLKDAERWEALRGRVLAEIEKMEESAPQAMEEAGID